MADAREHYNFLKVIMIQIQNFINGQFQSATDPVTLDNYNPATGEAYSTLPDSDAVDVVFAIQAAKKAFTKWSALPATERSMWLNKIADGIENRFDEFAKAESIDTGKPLWLSKELDIPRAIQNFRFFASRILHYQSQYTDSGSVNNDVINYVERSPLGVAALITPWNLPLYLLTWKIAPCLATGNTAVCKPSEVTPMTAYLLAQVLEEIKFPPGVCNFVFGTGAKLGDTLTSHPGVAAVSFTGGTETGRKISESASSKFKKISLEMGGKNAAIVFEDANLKKAVSSLVRSAFLNQGEICLCNERYFIQESIYKEFLEMFVEATSKLKVGDPFDKDTFMGPLVSKAHLEKVTNAVERMKQDKAKVIFGGNSEPLSDELKTGYYFQPTIIEDLSDCSELQQEEIFGPVASFRPFKGIAEAIKWTNTTPYGLSTSIWTQDLTKAHKVASKIDVGTVWVNTWMKRDLRMPFGGMKDSGVGREGGDYSFDFFTETKTICIQL